VKAAPVYGVKKIMGVPSATSNLGKRDCDESAFAFSAQRLSKRCHTTKESEQGRKYREMPRLRSNNKERERFSKCQFSPSLESRR
jgi:hypothetical protein